MSIDYDMKILVVDDSRMMRNLIRKNFISSGFTNIDLAINGKEAMSML